VVVWRMNTDDWLGIEPSSLAMGGDRNNYSSPKSVVTDIM
jgi:hypothetical protein